MATYNGITLTPNTGSGTGQLSVSAAEYTGRESRSATFSASNTNLDIDSNNSIKITQSGHVIFSVSSPTINSDVTSVTVQGQSNLESIRITGSGTLWNYLSTATIDGVTVTKSQLTQGYTVTGDPGASAVYDISFSFVGLPESVDLVTYNGYINNSSSLKVTVKKRGTGTIVVNVSSIDVIPGSLDIGIGDSYKYNDQTITVNSNSRNKLTYEVSPQDASVVSAAWSSSNTSVATVSSSGLVTGKSEGTATITCTVTDANGHTASDTCTVNVYEQGTITIAGNLTILYNELSRSVAVSHSGIMTNSTWTINKETRPWISSVTINQAHTSITATRVTSDQTSLPASTNMYLTATDRLRNTVTSNTVVLAQEMRAAIDGVDAIAVVSNKSTYTASYLPFNITGSDNQVEWYIGNAQQAPYASISDTTAVSCSLNVLEGANNQIVLLALRNTTDNSITASKEVMTTYVTEALDHPFTFESGTDNVTVAAQDVNDYTPHIILRSVPAVSISDLRVSSRTGELASAAINSKNHKIFTTFTANTSASTRSLGTLQVTYGTGSEAFSLPVYYSQEGIPATDTNTILDAQDPTARYRNGDITVGSTVVFTNNRDVPYTFKGLRCMVTGYDSDDGPESTTSEILFTHALSIANNEVQVPANDSVEKLYSDTWSWSGDWSEVKSIYLYWNASNKQSDTVKIILSDPTPDL